MNSFRFRIASAAALLLAAAGSFALTAARGEAAEGGRASDALQAIATARSTTPHGAPYDVESEHRSGALVWEVKLGTGGGQAVEVTVGGDGKGVLGRHALAGTDAEARWVGSTKVRLAAALRIADAATRGRFDEAELDREGGRLVWSASFGSGRAETEVEVSAANGRIVGHDDD